MSATQATTSATAGTGEEPAKVGVTPRYIRFHQAFTLASKKGSTRWSVKDFAQCFPTWAGEDANEVADKRLQVSQHMQDAAVDAANVLLEQYHAAETIDSLHYVILEGRARLASKDPLWKDIWKGDLKPDAAARARTVPVLMNERDRLKAMLAEVEAKNAQLAKEVAANKAGRIEANAKTKELLDNLDQAVASFSALPLDDMEQWMVEADEEGTT